VSFFSSVEAIFDPGGDPAQIRIAASAHRQLAVSMQSAGSAGDKVALGLADTWKGENSQGKAAATAFQDAWHNLSGEIETYAEHLNTVAAELDQIADQLEKTQQEAARLREMAEAALAAGVILTVFSFGMSDEAAAAAIAVETSEATTLMAFLGDVLDAAATALDGLIDALIRVAARFIMGAVMSWASEAFTKWKQHLDPWSLSSYSPEDVANIILGGILTAYMQEVPSSFPLMKAAMEAMPLRAALVYGFTGGTLGSAISQKFIEGEPIDYTKVLGSGGIAAGSGLVLGGMQAGYRAYTNPNPGLDSLLPSEKQGNITGITSGDVIRGSIGIPSGAIQYFINYPKPGTPVGPPGASQEPFADPAAATPPAVTWVKDGQNLFEITGGNPEQIAEIAKLDGIPDENLIYPGEVVISPPSSDSSG
jgi:uncharacterized protein YukE